MKKKYDVIILLILSFIIIVLDIKNDNYNILKIFPWIFTFCYILFLRTSIFKYKSISASCYTVLNFIRFILIPYLFVFGNYYPKVWYSFVLKKNSLYLGTFLMCYEIFIGSILVRFLSKKLLKYKNKKIKLYGDKYLYILLFIIAICLYFISNNKNEILNFFIIRNNTGERIKENITKTIMIKRQVILAAVTFIFLANVVKSNLEKNKDKIIIILYGILNVSILFGERRIFQIYTYIATLYIIKYYFREKSKKILFPIGLSGLFSIILFSIYKFFQVFNNDSYIKSIKNSSFNLSKIARIFDSYYMGVFNTTISINMLDYSNHKIRLLYDFLYGIFGINFLLKGKMLLTSQYYNNLLYKDKNVMTGQLIAGVSYGYIYLGFIFSIIIPIINICIMFYIERKMKETKSIEMKYMLFYVLLRIGLGIIGITSPLISYSTMYLGTVGLIYYSLLILKKIMRGKYENSINIWNKTRSNKNGSSIP